MKAFWSIIILVFLSSLVYSQSGANPFDIQERMDSVYQPRETNVFDIERKADVDHKNDINYEEKENATEIQGTNIQVPQTIEKREPKDPRLDLSENPFEVSHVPVRNSKLKREADAFKTRQYNDVSNTSKSSSNTFLFWMVLFSALLLAIVINTKPKAILKLSKAIFNENMLMNNQREERNGISGHYLLFYCIFFINAAIFAYLLAGEFLNKRGYMVYFYCLTGILVVYLVKHLSIMFMGIVFPVQRDSKLYSFTVETYNIMAGIILLPLNLIIAFGPVSFSNFFLYLSVAILGVLLLLRVFRSLLIATTYIQNKTFHFFLYLCTMEIIPILLICKLIL